MHLAGAGLRLNDMSFCDVARRGTRVLRSIYRTRAEVVGPRPQQTLVGHHSPRSPPGRSAVPNNAVGR